MPKAKRKKLRIFQLGALHVYNKQYEKHPVVVYFAIFEIIPFCVRTSSSASK